MSVIEDFDRTSSFGTQFDIDRKGLVDAFHRAFHNNNTTPDLKEEKSQDIQAFYAYEMMDKSARSEFARICQEGRTANQLAFAARIARISSAHAARRAEGLAKRHRRVSLARRCALLLMVLAINLPVFL